MHKPLPLNQLIPMHEALKQGKGSMVNRNFWGLMLAEAFPQIMEVKDGVVQEFEFMGRMYTLKEED